MSLACATPVPVHSATVAAAYARAPRRRPEPRRPLSGNNYVAEAGRRPGAPAGNRNAWRHGRYSRETLARRKAVGGMIGAVRNSIALYKLAKAGVGGLLPLMRRNEEASRRHYWALITSLDAFPEPAH